MTTRSNTGQPIMFTRHALDRYRERVQPALGYREVVDAVRRILAHGRISGEAPSWLAQRQRTSSSHYLEIGDVVFPLRGGVAANGRLVAVTCIARGGISAPARQRRKAKNQRRR